MQDTTEQNDYKIEDLKPQKKYSDNPKNVFEMSGYQFNKYFMDKIYPDLIKAAHGNIKAYSDLSKIKKTEKTRKKWGIVFLILLCISCVFPLLIFILFPIAAYLIYLERKRKTPFARAIKYMVFSHFNIKILPKYDDFSFSIPSHNVVEKIFLLSSSTYSVDDFLLFTYKDLPIKMAEVSIIVQKGKHSKVLRHILIGSKINKKFNKETFLCTKDRGIPFGLTFNRQQVLLEDSIFNDNFKVFSEDQIEARYLLTPSFMSRILKYKLARKSSLNIVFNNNISSGTNVFLDIDIPLDKDFFEITDDPLSAKTYWDILQEIKEILEIIDALKLDQDIGL